MPQNEESFYSLWLKSRWSQMTGILASYIKSQVKPFQCKCDSGPWKTKWEMFVSIQSMYNNFSSSFTFSPLHIIGTYCWFIILICIRRFQRESWRKATHTGNIFLYSRCCNGYEIFLQTYFKLRFGKETQLQIIWTPFAEIKFRNCCTISIKTDKKKGFQIQKVPIIWSTCISTINLTLVPFQLDSKTNMYVKPVLLSKGV